MPSPPVVPERLPVPRGAAAAPPSGAVRARQIHEETRPLAGPAPPDPTRTDDSGLLRPDAEPVDVARWDQVSTHPGAGGLDPDLEGIGERTLITGGAGGSFMLDLGSDDGVEATLVNAAVPDLDAGGAGDAATALEAAAAFDDDAAPTLTRDRGILRASAAHAPPPPALAAKIHAPAVSALRAPRPSRRTPPGGAPIASTGHQSVLAAIVGAQASEPMPVPLAGARADRGPAPPPPAPATDADRASAAAMQPTQIAPSPDLSALIGAAGSQPDAVAPRPAGAHLHDASGLPLALPTPPGLPLAAQGAPVAAAYDPRGEQAMYPPYGGPVSPGALYQLQPYGAPQPLSLTGQLRLSEVDEIPAQYKIRSGSARWLWAALAGTAAVAVAAVVTFAAIRALRSGGPAKTVLIVESVPSGATVYADGSAIEGTTRLEIAVAVGSRVQLRVELARHKSYTETVHIDSETPQAVMARLEPYLGRVRVDTQPAGAEIWIDGKLRGRTPTTVPDLDLAASRKLELRLKDYDPHVQDLIWPDNGVISVNVALKLAGGAPKR
jgi:hypothetical protein